MEKHEFFEQILKYPPGIFDDPNQETEKQKNKVTKKKKKKLSEVQNIGKNKEGKRTKKLPLCLSLCDDIDSVVMNWGKKREHENILEKERQKFRSLIERELGLYERKEVLIESESLGSCGLDQIEEYG